MLRTETRVRTNRDAAGAVDRGTKRALFDAADAGFAQSQADVPVGATSGLAHSGFEPREAPDGAIVWGYGAKYALPVVDGSRPHWIPLRAMDSLKRWARRVLGSESAAWGVRRKIAQEGTPAQDFITPAIERQVAHLRANGISGAIVDELRSRTP